MHAHVWPILIPGGPNRPPQAARHNNKPNIMTSSTTITTGLGSLSTLQEDEIYLNILEMSFRPCDVDLSQFTGNIRAVVSPSLDTNAFGPSKDMKQMSGFVSSRTP